jgi:hypothetical protein
MKSPEVVCYNALMDIAAFWEGGEKVHGRFLI